MPSITNVYTLHSVQRTGAASTIDQIERQSIDSGLTDYLGGGSSSIAHQFAALMGAAPVIAFTTSRIATALALIGLTGLQATTTNTLVAWFKKRASYAQYASSASSVHRKMTVSNGLLVPRRLSVRQGDVASLECEIHTCVDGSVAPASQVFPIVTGVAALPSALVGNEYYTVGPIALDGTTFDSIQDVNIDFGIELEKITTKGELYPAFLAIKAIKPVIEFTMHDLVHAADAGGTPAAPTAGTVGTFGLHGGIAASTGLKVYLRKKAADGTGNVIDATAEHVAITASDLRFKWASIESSHQEDATIRVRCEPIDNTSTLWAVSTTSAIT